jgi:hypothetical protein
MLTESDELATALDAAARIWPEADGNRAVLLRMLIDRGASSIERSDDARRATRLAAIRQTSGALANVYRRNEASLLRDEWPE